MSAKYSADPGGEIVLTRVDDLVDGLVNWGRKSSLFYLLFGLAFRLVRSRLGPHRALALAPVLWVGM